MIMMRVHLAFWQGKYVETVQLNFFFLYFTVIQGFTGEGGLPLAIGEYATTVIPSSSHADLTQFSSGLQ
jgi:hypothetical protein